MKLQTVLKNKKVWAVMTGMTIILLVLIASWLLSRNKINEVAVFDAPTEKNVSQVESPALNHKELSPLTGTACANPLRRPVAVMLSGDVEARPLSGIAEADVVVEMPVVTGSIARYMAVFGCETPKEIGSVRSARHDFIPLAAGFDALFAHWGGSHFALNKLRRGGVDDVDALALEGSVFYRKRGIYAPHNGFTDLERIFKYATGKKFHLDNRFSGYTFANAEEIKPTVTGGRLLIGYPKPFDVAYEFDVVRNAYLRAKGGRPEIDKNTGAQVMAQNVVVLFVTSRQIEGQYNDVDIESVGSGFLFRGGVQIPLTWSKDAKSLTSKLIFKDATGAEVKLAPGKTWIQAVEKGEKVVWQPQL